MLVGYLIMDVATWSYRVRRLVIDPKYRRQGFASLAVMSILERALHVGKNDDNPA